MSDTKKPATTQSFEERKKALIAQGASQRAKIDASIVIIRENMHADKLAKNAMNHVTAKVYGAVDKMFGRHHADKVDLSTDLGPTGGYDPDTGISSSFANLSNDNHALGKLIATARRFLPLATTAVSILRRRRLVMPAFKGAAVLGGIGAGVYFYQRHQQKAQDEAADSDALPYDYYPEAARPGVLDAQGQLH